MPRKKFQQTLWPSLEYTKWSKTLETLHLYTQIVGKIKLVQNPFLNQWWEVALFTTSRGLTTGRIPYKAISFEITFDFFFHSLSVLTSTGEEQKIPLCGQSVADFYHTLITSLENLGISVSVSPLPSEMPGFTTPFAKDTKHSDYDRDAVARWFGVLLNTSFILDTFRTRFRGKSSPVQFFWGSFDLNETRFSGKKLTDKTNWPKGYHFMRYAENEENFSCGFWPGNEKFPVPSFYSYLYPAPIGCERIETGSALSYFDRNLAECILPYEKARNSENPTKEILTFFQTTYKELAKLAGWNLKELEAKTP